MTLTGRGTGWRALRRNHGAMLGVRLARLALRLH